MRSGLIDTAARQTHMDGENKEISCFLVPTRGDLNIDSSDRLPPLLARQPCFAIPTTPSQHSSAPCRAGAGSFLHSIFSVWSCTSWTFLCSSAQFPSSRTGVLAAVGGRRTSKTRTVAP